MIICDSEREVFTDNVNVFDRSSLQFTVKLIRSHNPSLALRIQNIIAPVLRKDSGDYDKPEADDLFTLALDSFTLKRVVETLAISGQVIAEAVLLTHEGDQSELLTTKDVIGKWLLYARQHQAEVELRSARAKQN